MDNTSRDFKYWLICGALIVLGGGAMIWGGPWDASRSIIKELGSAVFTAGIIAAFVETYFRREFARDAFFAALRHILPAEFRDEIEKIIRFDFIAEHQIWTVQIEKQNDDVALVTTTLEKIVRNKTNTNKKLEMWVETEDYHFPNGKTEIVECVIEHKSQESRSSAQTDHDHYLEVKTQALTIPPNETAKLSDKVKQYRRLDDSLFETFRTPIVNPQIRVLIDDNEFLHEITFGTYGDKTKSKYENLYTLSGVYFPGQFMVVRWWPKNARRE
jgi:hypothetical protein